MKSKKYNPHSWFFAYIRRLPDYDSTEAEAIKRMIVSKYSGGKTSSIAALLANYPAIYYRMKREFTNKAYTELDAARKRVIACIFDYLKQKGIKANMEYVKAVAVRASGQERFNDITLNQLKQLYQAFGSKKLSQEDKELLNQIEQYYGSTNKTLN